MCLRIIGTASFGLAMSSGCMFFPQSRGSSNAPELIDTEAAYIAALQSQPSEEKQSFYTKMLADLRYFSTKSLLEVGFSKGSLFRSNLAVEAGFEIASFGKWIIDNGTEEGLSFLAASYSTEDPSSVASTPGVWKKIPLLRASNVKVRLDSSQQQHQVDLCLFSQDQEDCREGYVISIKHGGYKISSPSTMLCSLTATPDGAALQQQRQMYVDLATNRAYPYTRVEVDALYGHLRVSVNGTEICRRDVPEIGKRVGYFLVNSGAYAFSFPRGTEPVFVEESAIDSVQISPNFPREEQGGEENALRDSFVRDVLRVTAGKVDGFENGYFTLLLEKFTSLTVPQ